MNSKYEVNEKIERLKQRLQASSILNPPSYQPQTRYETDYKMTGTFQLPQ